MQVKNIPTIVPGKQKGGWQLSRLSFCSWLIFLQNCARSTLPISRKEALQNVEGPVSGQVGGAWGLTPFVCKAASLGKCLWWRQETGCANTKAACVFPIKPSFVVFPLFRTAPTQPPLDFASLEKGLRRSSASSPNKYYRGGCVCFEPGPVYPKEKPANLGCLNQTR